MGLIHVVVGGQFGSEAKGHVTAWLTKELSQIKAVVRVAGPNAGHTAVLNGKQWAFRQIPCAAIADPGINLVIGAGSEIDPFVLAAEIDQLRGLGMDVRERLIIDDQATVIEDRHRNAEALGGSGTGEGSLIETIGSTGKGVGAARANRIMRDAHTWGEYRKGFASNDPLKGLATGDTTHVLQTLLHGGDIIIEGTQGYGLGLHAGYYPYCTSSDCRAIDFLAMAGITPTFENQVRIWPVFRTYPIRVAGNSGPMHRETTWEELAEQSGGYIQPERTTVTQKIRRVGEWDSMLAQRAMQANGSTGWDARGIYPVLTFFDYVFPKLAGVTDRYVLEDDHYATISFYEAALQHRIAAVGTGPDSMISF
jgi:adenylosuccinate synthase